MKVESTECVTDLQFTEDLLGSHCMARTRGSNSENTDAGPVLMKLACSERWNMWFMGRTRKERNRMIGHRKK